MGYTIFLAVEARLKPDCPPNILAYFEMLGAGQEVDAPIPVEVENRLGTLPKPDWFDWSTVRLVHGDLMLTGAFNDDFVQHKYALLALIAEHAVDGPFGAHWTDMDKTTAEVCIASEGGLFFSRGKPALFAADPDRLPPIDPMLSKIPPKFFTNHGLSDTAAQGLRESLPSNPIASKVLLTRALRREVKNAVEAEPDPDQLVERIVRQVADVLDAGADPLAAPDSPGWRLVEHENRYDGEASTGRVMTGLGEVLQYIDDAATFTQPTRFEVGTEIVTLVDLTLQANRRGNQNIALGQGVSGSHVLTVHVPPGAILRISWVAKRGHAHAQTDEWPSWKLEQPTGRLRSEENPTAPLGDANDYELRFISLEDEGRLWSLA